MTPNRVLLTSVCKPIGPSVGDGESVGYELLHGQVTRSQHIYSPRVGPHLQYALDYIAENLDAPSVVLHYPSKRTFLEEIKKGYDFIGIAFVLSTVHHTIAMCQLIRQHSPSTKIVLGGYGTVMSDDELRPYCDAICREEGVAFMRNILDEPALPVEAYRHPDIQSRLRVFGIPAGHSAMVFAGLGCPNGCDFCCTSHFFKRKHIRLLPTGAAIFDVMNRYKNDHPDVGYTILDEDFLLNKQRAYGFLNRCREENAKFSSFCFSSVKALSQYTFDQLFEMGIDGVWVGYEGKQSGYAKQQGADIDQLIRNLQDHGIMVLTSTIVGIPYQTAEIAEHEFSDLMRNSPTLCQFMIYGPTPGTPFYEKVMSEGLLHEDLASDRMKYYKSCTGFTAMVKHPSLRRKEIETLQEEFYKRDFEMLGPSILRVTEVKLNGWNKYKNHENPLFREKAEKFRRKASMALALCPIAIFGPKIRLRNRIRYCRQFLRVFKSSSWAGRCYVLASPIVVVGALITWVKVTLGVRNHPMTRIHYYYGRNSQKKPVKRLRLLLKVGRSHPAC